MLAAATVDRIRTEAASFDLARALVSLLLVPFFAVGWTLAKAWQVVGLVVGLALLAYKEGWHSSRGDR